MSGPSSDWRRWTERRLASLKTTYAMPWTRWDPNPKPFSSLKVFKPKVLFGWLWTVWARISAYWDNGITPQAAPKLRPTRNARPQWMLQTNLGCGRTGFTACRCAQNSLPTAKTPLVSVDSIRLPSVLRQRTQAHRFVREYHELGDSCRATLV
jgi:hypothetical protein